MRPGLLRLGKPDGSGSDESSRDQILGYVEGRISQMTLVWASDLRRNQPYADEKSSKQEKRRSPSSAGGTFLLKDLSPNGEVISDERPRHLTACDCAGKWFTGPTGWWVRGELGAARRGLCAEKKCAKVRLRDAGRLGGPPASVTPFFTSRCHSLAPRVRSSAATSSSARSTAMLDEPWRERFAVIPFRNQRNPWVLTVPRSTQCGGHHHKPRSDTGSGSGNPAVARPRSTHGHRTCSTAPRSVARANGRHRRPASPQRRRAATTNPVHRSRRKQGLPTQTPTGRAPCRGRPAIDGSRAASVPSQNPTLSSPALRSILLPRWQGGGVQSVRWAELVLIALRQFGHADVVCSASVLSRRRNAERSRNVELDIGWEVLRPHKIHDASGRTSAGIHVIHDQDGCGRKKRHRDRGENQVTSLSAFPRAPVEPCRGTEQTDRHGQRQGRPGQPADVLWLHRPGVTRPPSSVRVYSSW